MRVRPRNNRLLLVSPDRLFHDCLSARMVREGIGRVERAGDLAQAEDRAARQAVDLLLVDLPRLGAKTARGLSALSRRHPGLKMVVRLGPPADGADPVRLCRRAGVSGMLSWDASWEELVGTLDRVLADDETVCGAEIARSLFDRLGELGRDGDEAPVGFDDLTPRQQEVLRLLADGLRNREIADRLGISVATVKAHVHTLLERLAVRDRTEATALALREGWL